MNESSNNDDVTQPDRGLPRDEPNARKASPYWARIVLVGLVTLAVVCMLAYGLLRNRGYTSEADRYGAPAMWATLGITFFFYAMVNVRYIRLLPLWLSVGYFGASPVDRCKRPKAYSFGIATLVLLGILCLFASVVWFLYGPS